jgi:ABC-2 type transport system permease protein
MTTTSTPATLPAPSRTGLASGERPVPAGAMSASMTFAWRSVMKIRHVPEQLADVILIPVMFTLLFTYLFGGALAGSTSAYLQYLLPGTLVMAILTVTIYTGVTLNTDLTSGAYDRFRSLPISSAAPLLGGLLGDVGRYLIAAGLVIGLGLVMGYRPAAGLIGLLSGLPLILVLSFSLSWAWLALALVLRTPNSVQIVGFVILVPLTFASNTFVDPQTMPSLLRGFVELNPVSHLVTAVRGLAEGSVLADEIAWVLVTSAALLVVFAPLTGFLFRRRG